MVRRVDDNQLDPETEKELRAAMDSAAQEERKGNTVELAQYMRDNYLAYRAKGFSRKQAWTFTILLYQNLIR